jgi:prephenate dehydrogenase
MRPRRSSRPRFLAAPSSVRNLGTRPNSLFARNLIGSGCLASTVLFPRLALIGVGYIGGSAALAARRAGLVGSVVGCDVSHQACQQGRGCGVLDDVAESPAAAVAGASLVLLAAPVGSLPALIASIAGHLDPSATVIDVGSVKLPVMAQADSVLQSGAFVACHPMAGAEHVGVGAADPSIFAGRVCYLCPGTRTRSEAVDAATRFWQGVGCHIAKLDAALHDQLMAAVSHLPHVAAYALAGCLGQVLPVIEANAVAPTTSLRDTIRIAASSPQVWRDIFLTNRDHLLPLVHALEQNIHALGQAMVKGDAQALEAALATGQDNRRRLLK